ncbi:hypothetical protein RHMOL_Rhmol09G0197800 [Rhododendron molle]|uniref:Uncharacterized protein n=1 Tax=Rhododendron molle TaxID=49168 RepID=A0ACC0MGJ6_RHOML|nr:hypothetical protein RHMOL_Rhmol09G0197800 [Rhododendron molle]
MGDGRIQLNIKFGGKFEGNPFHTYIDGDICYSRVIPYEFSYADLVTVMQEIGCYPWRSFFYLRPGHGIENGLSEITSDVDMTEMFVLYEGEDKDIECFVTHLDVEEDDEEWLGWEGKELGLEDLRNAQNADDEEEEDEQEQEQEIGKGGQCVTDSGNGGDNQTDSDSDSDFICSGLRDSSSSDGDDIEYEQNEGVDGDEGGCLPVRNFHQEDLGQGVVITEVEESDNSDENVSVGNVYFLWLLQLETRETSPCPLIPTAETMPRGRGRGVPKRRGVQTSIGRGVGRGATSAATTQRIGTRGLTNVQMGVGRRVARGIPNTAATTERVVTRGFANAKRGVARGVACGRGQIGTIGKRSVGTGVTSRKGVARGLAVTATIGGQSVVGTGGARTTRSTTFDGVRAVQSGGARSDRDGGTRRGGTSDAAKTVEAGTMLRQGKKIYLKSQQSQQAWKIATIGDGVFSSKATKGWTKGSTQ